MPRKEQSLLQILSKPLWMLVKPFRGSAKPTILFAVFWGLFVAGISPVWSAAGNSTDTTSVVSLIPSVTEILFAMDAGDQVVGVSDFCRYPPEVRQLPAVGGLINPSLEGVLRLRPGVVLLYRSQQDFASRLNSLGIKTELFQVDSLADLYAAIERVGVITSKQSRAEQLSSHIRSSLAEVRMQANRTTATVSGVVVVSRDPAGLKAMYQAGSGNFLGELFQLAGGVLAIKGEAAISREDVVRAQPQLIIDMSGTETAESIEIAQPVVKELGPWAALQPVPAVQNSHVYSWKDPHSMLLGPSVVDTARRMRELIRGVATKDVPIQIPIPE